MTKETIVMRFTSLRYLIGLTFVEETNEVIDGFWQVLCNWYYNKNLCLCIDTRSI